MQLKELLPTTISDYWEERANKVLSNFNYQEPDEIDIYDICWKYGIKIRKCDVEESYSVPKQGRRGTIYLSSALDSEMERVVLAEEFCHLYAHSMNQLNAGKHFIQKSENQAKRMAAYLLMPNKFMKTVYIMAAFTNQGVLIEEVSDYFVVPEEFAHYRLQLDASRQMGTLLRKWRGEYGSIEWIE